MKAMDRFMRRVLVTDTCWEWQAPCDKNGYGIFYLTRSERYAHRAAYTLFKESIPADMTVDHTCFNPRCVNPDHLRLLPMLVNARLQRSAFKTHCKNGHQLTPDNTYIRPRRLGGGRRDCRTCICERARRYKRANRGQFRRAA